MTYQIPDTLVYNGEEYQLLGDYTSKLPMLNRYGIEPAYAGTAFVKGYAANYVIDNGVLYLSSLIVRDANNHYPPIGGVEVKSNEFGRATYNNLHERMNLNGQIVIGERLAYGMSLKHDIVLRMSFDDGELKTIENITHEYSALVKKIDEIFAERNSLSMRLFANESKRNNHRKDELNELFGEYLTLRHGLAPEDQNLPLFK